MAKRMKVLTINQSNWLSGDVLKYSRAHCEGALNSSLRDGITGLQCCLGFACIAGGAPKDDLINVALPTGMSPVSFTDEADYEALTCIENEASEVNDDRDLTLTQRKAQLRKIFKRLDTTLKFTGSIATAKRKVATAYKAGKL